MHLKISLLLLICYLFNTPIASTQISISPHIGYGNVLFRDACFSLVKQRGFGPKLGLTLAFSRKKSLHSVDVNFGTYRFNSIVRNPNNGVKGIHQQSHLGYQYLHQVRQTKQLTILLGTGMAYNYSKTTLNGLLVNNSPLHDFNLQMELCYHMKYIAHVFHHALPFQYQIGLPIVGYNNRPDYLGFVEFSGHLKFFNSTSTVTWISSRYCYLQQRVLLGLNKKWYLRYQWNYAHNTLSNTYQNLTQTLEIGYVKQFGK
jgi:hypothetical protein